MRFMPVEGVCYAGLEDISKLAKKLLPEHFPADTDAATVTVSEQWSRHTTLVQIIAPHACGLQEEQHIQTRCSQGLTSSCRGGAVWCAV